MKNNELPTWEGYIEYGGYSSNIWHGIPDLEHPMVKTLISRIRSEVKYLDEFELYVIGGALEEWISWDIDFGLVGEYQPEKIKSIFEKITEIGFGMGIYTDLHYQKKLWRIDEYSLENDNSEEVDAWHLSNTFTKNDHTEVYNNHILIDGLYKTTIKYPFEKHIERIKEGYKYKSPIKIN